MNDDFGMYLNLLSLKIGEKSEKFLELEARKKTIIERLRPYFSEVKTHNLAYDEKRDVIIVFDLLKKLPQDAD
jgi:hypothetical protein